jgi:sugar phosphate isomerase/epimerase
MKRRALLGMPLVALAARAEDQPPAKVYDLKLGVATYSLRNFTRAQAIRMVQELGVRYVNVKEVHLPYKAMPEELTAGVQEFREAGLEIVGGGTISLNRNDEAELRRYFEYARICGFRTMICAPTHETLPLVEKLAKEYNIAQAIHNHGPEDKHFPSPYDVLKAVKGRDARMGLCIDVGHTMRTGTDVVKAIADAGPRLYSIHMKDLRKNNESRSQVEVGKGLMPVAAIFRQLKKMKYAGCVDLEYEINARDPLTGMKESFAYMRGVLDGMRTAPRRV